MTGYFEDRRPSSNMDPYVVCGMIAYTTILWNPGQDLNRLLIERLDYCTSWGFKLRN
jgi:hypothetical protein